MPPQSKNQMPTDAVEAAESQLKEKIKALQKTKDRLSRAKKDLATMQRPVAVLRKLASDLGALPAEPVGPDFGKLAAIIAGKVDECVAQSDKQFQTILREQATAAGLPIGRSADCLTVGPFLLKLDAGAESASLEYAKMDLERRLALDSSKIVSRAAELTRTLLAQPSRSDLQSLASEVEEAIRVVHARNKQTIAGDLRAELP